MPEFKQFIQERIYLQNVSPRTVEWYRQIFKWLEKYRLTEEGLKSLLVEMRQARLEATSCNNRLRVCGHDLGIFFEFCHFQVRARPLEKSIWGEVCVGKSE